MRLVGLINQLRSPGSLHIQRDDSGSKPLNTVVFKTLHGHPSEDDCSVLPNRGLECFFPYLRKVRVLSLGEYE